MQINISERIPGLMQPYERAKEVKQIIKAREALRLRLSALVGRPILDFQADPQNTLKLMRVAKEGREIAPYVPIYWCVTSFPFICGRCGHIHGPLNGEDKPYRYQVIKGKEVGECCYDVEKGKLRNKI